MDYIQGEELWTHLRDITRFSEEQAKYYVAMIAMGIGYLHDMKLIHRDLKLENILMGDDGYLYLSDFGLTTELSTDGNIINDRFCGTIDYIAPEILSGEKFGKPADWWALGVIAYELIVG